MCCRQNYSDKHIEALVRYRDSIDRFRMNSGCCWSGQSIAAEPRARAGLGGRGRQAGGLNQNKIGRGVTFMGGRAGLNHGQIVGLLRFSSEKYVFYKCVNIQVLFCLFVLFWVFFLLSSVNFTSFFSNGDHFLCNH